MLRSAESGSQMGAPSATAPTLEGTIWDELVAELPVGVVLQDEQGTVLAANKLAAGMLGLTQSQLLRESWPAGWSACDDSGAPLPSQSEIAEQVLRNSAVLNLPIVISRDRLPDIRVWAAYHPVRLHGEPRLLLVLHPVDTDVPRSQGLLDPLTGLPGRPLLLDRLQQALTRARTLGTLSTLVLVDVRKLATINVQYGFSAGDQLLVGVAGRLRAGLRDDYTVARYGGDEFAVVTEHASGTGADLAGRVHELAGRPLRIGRSRLQFGVNVSWCTSDGSAPAHEILARAEEQLRAG